MDEAQTNYKGQTALKHEITSVSLSKNAASAFQIPCKLFSFTLEDSWRNIKRMCIQSFAMREDCPEIGWKYLLSVIFAYTASLLSAADMGIFWNEREEQIWIFGIKDARTRPLRYVLSAMTREGVIFFKESILLIELSNRCNSPIIHVFSHVLDLTFQYKN